MIFVSPNLIAFPISSFAFLFFSCVNFMVNTIRLSLKFIKQ